MDPALLANFPLTPPPQGVVSNFTDPETRAPVIIAFIAICLALTWPVFLLRLYSKIFVVGKFSWDDGKYQAFHNTSTYDEPSNIFYCNSESSEQLSRWAADHETKFHRLASAYSLASVSGVSNATYLSYLQANRSQK